MEVRDPDGPDGDDRIGSPDALTVVPVPPDTDSVGKAVGRIRDEGDVILALPHGSAHRELHPAAEGLYVVAGEAR
jgi:hypothetical protein